MNYESLEQVLTPAVLVHPGMCGLHGETESRGMIARLVNSSSGNYCSPLAVRECESNYDWDVYCGR